MRKLLLGLALVLLIFAAVGATATARASTLLSDDYEGAAKWNPNSSGWNISTSYAVSGTHSAHAPSQVGMVPKMIYGPYDLSAATAATLSFELNYDAPRSYSPPSPPGAACGAFVISYSTDGSWFTSAINFNGGTGAEWEPFSYDLNSASFPLVGQPKVWLAFSTSQSSIFATTSSGAYVDDLSLTATVPDAVAPTTTATGAVNGRWYRTPVTVNLAATDNAGGSGVASTEYALDGAGWAPGVSIPLPAPADHSNDKLHTILYRSADTAGNVEAAKTLKVGIDTRRPTTRAPYSATARRGYTATLKYKVVEVGAHGGTATVTIKVRNRAATVVKTLSYTGRTVNVVLAGKFTVPRTWRIGTYHFSVYAKDRAGNIYATPVGVNHLYVK